MYRTAHPVGAGSTALSHPVGAGSTALPHPVGAGLTALPQEAPLTWWRLELTLHHGQRVAFNVRERPDARQILLEGWHDSRPNGDAIAIGYDAIATVKITGHTGQMQGATSW